MTSPISARDNAHLSDAAIRVLARRGFEATTARDLAEALGVSRSTFFRRFGTKEDVVFVDHDEALEQLTEHLDPARGEHSVDDELSPIVTGTVGVFERLSRDTETARLKYELLRSNPALRDRELIMSQRYEAVFARFLRARFADAPDWCVQALAAGIVAVHNAALRTWLRAGGSPDSRSLQHNLQRLCALFAAPLDASGKRQTRVLVAAFDARDSVEAVLGAVERSLRADAGLPA